MGNSFGMLSGASAGGTAARDPKQNFACTFCAEHMLASPQASTRSENDMVRDRRASRNTRRLLNTARETFPTV